MLLYILIEGFAWYTTVWEYSKAHEQFYYAHRRNVRRNSNGDKKRPPLPQDASIGQLENPTLLLIEF